MIVVIVVLIIAIIAIVAFALRLFSIERVDSIEQTEDTGEEQPSDGDERQGAGELPQPDETHSVFDYFGEKENESKPDAAQPPKEYDKLTGVVVGRSFLAECKIKLDEAAQEGFIYCAAYFDYDRFSFINSLKGFSTGDYVLTNTAQEIKRIFPEGALLTRISGDHFAAVFPLTDLSLFDEYYSQLKQMAEKLLLNIGTKSGLRMCLGYATTDTAPSYDISVLLAKANIARHCAKVTKADKFEIYDESMITSHFFGERLMDAFGECQYAEDLVMHYMPVSDLAVNRIVFCDALSHWAHPEESANIEGGRLPKGSSKLLYQNCRTMRRWKQAGKEAVPVLSEMVATEFFAEDLDDFLARCLSEFQLEPHLSIIKIDLSIVRLDWSMCSKQLKKLKDLDAKICISGIDAGAGALDALSGLPVDYLKLQQGIAHNADKESEQLDRCRRMLTRAQELGAHAIFEGVHTKEVAEALQGVGARYVQGRYSGKPVSGDQLSHDLIAHVENHGPDATVILDDSALSKGEFNVF